MTVIILSIGTAWLGWALLDLAAAVIDRRVKAKAN